MLPNNVPSTFYRLEQIYYLNCKTTIFGVIFLGEIIFLKGKNHKSTKVNGVDFGYVLNEKCKCKNVCRNYSLVLI